MGQRGLHNHVLGPSAAAEVNSSNGNRFVVTSVRHSSKTDAKKRWSV